MFYKINFFFRVFSNQIKQNSKKSVFNITLIHKPNVWEDIKLHTDLMLSGHTHNGQIFPINFIVKLKFPQNYGLYHKMNNYLYVSSGSATWGPKIRIGSNNEIIQIKLKN